MITRVFTLVLFFLLIISVVVADTPYKAFLNKKTNCYIEANTKSKRLASLSADQDINVIEEVASGNKTWLKIQFDNQGEIVEGYIAPTNVVAYTPLSVYKAILSDGDSISILNKAKPIGNSASDIPLNGTATVVFEGAGYYSGSFVDAKRSGKGIFAWNNGDRYIGNWLNDEISGEGVLTFSDGVSYQGVFQSGNLKEGTATYPQSENRYLTRDIINGKLSSESSLYWPDGTCITGQIPSGKNTFMGKVTITYSCGDVYKGTLKEGLKSGTGTYQWSDGSHYEGSWAFDMMNGKGSYYFQEGKKGDYITGTFMNNLPEESITLMHGGKRYRSIWDVDMCTDIYEK